MKNHITFTSTSNSSGEDSRDYSIESDDPSMVSLIENHDRKQRELDYELVKGKTNDEMKMMVLCVVLILAIAMFMAIFG